MSKKIIVTVLVIAIIAFLAVCGVLRFMDVNLAAGLAFIVGGAYLLIPILIRNPEFGITLMAFFLPFERIPSFEVGNFSIKINYVLIFVVGIIYLTVRMAKNQIRIPKDPTRFLVSLFIVIAALSMTQAINLGRASEVFALLALMGLLYLLVTISVNEEREFIAISKGIFWGALIAGIFGLWQFFGDAIGLPNAITLLKIGYDKSTFGFARIQSTSIEPLYFANYLFIPIALTVVMLLNGTMNRIVNWKIAYLALAIFAVNFVLTVSRGAYIGMIAMIVALLIFQVKLIFRIKTILALLLVFIAVFGGAFLALYKNESRALDEFIAHVAVEDRTEGESVVSRLNAAEQAIELYKNHPVLGIGIGNFGPNVQFDPSETPDEGWFIVNDEYLEILAEMGMVGLIVFALIILSLYIRAFIALAGSKNSFMRIFLSSMLIALLGILVQYATFSTIYIFHIWFTIALVSAATIKLLDYEKTR